MKLDLRRPSSFKPRILILMIAIGFQFLNLQANAQSQKIKGINYVSPFPASTGNSVKTNIILRFDEDMRPIQDYVGLFQISANGHTIPFHFTAQADPKKLILQPNNALPAGSIILVKSLGSLHTLSDVIIPEFSFVFNTYGKSSFEAFLNEEKIQEYQDMAAIQNTRMETLSSKRTISTDIANQLPFAVTTSKNEASDYYLVGSMFTNRERAMIVNGKGEIVYDRKSPYMVVDFKMHREDTTFSFVKLAAAVEDYRIIVMDKFFNDIDSINAGNGYLLDIHELVKDKNTGNKFILATRVIDVDLSKMFAGGLVNAKLLDLIIQELDANNNVVFEWKCYDHLPLTDAVGVDYTSSGVIDWVHCNAINLDTDTTLLLSSRHLNEVTRIDRRSGRIIWRLGPNASTQNFNFINDDDGFTYQHNPQKLPNGNILLFDNGNFKPGTRYTRVVEYQLNEATMECAKVWEYRRNPDVISDFMGSVQRLPNGNTLIGWGSANPTFTEIDSNKQVVCEGTFPNNVLCYRVQKANIGGLLSDIQPQFSMPANFTACKLNDSNYVNKFNDFMQPFVDSRVPKDFQLMTLNNNQLKVIMEDTVSRTYAFHTRNIIPKTVHPSIKDTTVCSGPGLLNISMNDGCGNSGYQWSNGLVNQTISYDMQANINKVWVTTNNGPFTQTDTITLRVSPVTEFEIIGNPVLDRPFEIINYSVPFYKGASYSWKSINGNIISGYESNAVQVQWSNKPVGYLQTTITDAFGCIRYSPWDTITYGAPSGFEDINNMSGFSVYPSPFHDNFKIKATENASFLLYNLHGERIQEGKLDAGNTLEISGNNLPSGLYILELVSTDKQYRVKVMKD